MKVFIKLLLVISLLSGNISYAGANKPKNIESRTSTEQQERLEELHELVLKLEGKKKLIEEFIVKKGDVITNFDTKLGVITIATILIAALGVSRYRAAPALYRYNERFKRAPFEPRYKLTDEGITVFYLSGISVVGAGGVLTEVVNGFAELSESEFNEKLVDSTPLQNQVLYTEIGKQIDKTKKEIQVLEESIMNHL